MASDQDSRPRRVPDDSYRNVFNSVAESIYVLDEDGFFLEVNDSAVRMYGYTREELIGRTAEFISAPGMNDSINLGPMYSKAASGIVQVFEWWGLRKNGSIFPKEVTLTRGYFNGSTVIIAGARDISDTKMLQAQFLRAQRLDSLGTLAGGIAHDLNNVLAPILMAVQMLRAKPEGDRKMRALTAIEESATRGKEILQQVLTFAKGVEGETTVFNPKLLVREIEYLIKETFPRSIQIRTHVPGELWMLSANITRIHQVVMNLCVNARDAMDKGGVLGIMVENLCVLDEFARTHKGRSGPHIVFTVTDTGEGIPAAIIEKVFDPFFTTKEQGRGTGLGLSTVHSIVKGYGGFITVTSEVHVGTTVKVYLPAVVDGTETPTVDTARELRSGSGECILLIDDEQSIVSVTREILEMNGYQVITASNGKEGLAAYDIHKDRIELVLTDIMMPMMDGYTMMRAMRSIKPGLKIIAASGLPVTIDLVEPAVTAADAFLTKPYSVATLLSVIHSVLHSAESETSAAV
ncbi:MAG TPA: ATP-binding protein [Bacteroidota bacterium]|nr:ATP-binding protein [Bacteroidota bacterium]